MTKKFFLSMLLWLLLLSSSAFAAFSLEAPEKAARESAFVATAISDTPVQTVQFNWAGKIYPINTTKEGNRWVAKILLPVAAGDKAASHTLSARADGNLHTEKTISLYNVKRPVQKLTVDRKYVEPPKEVQERIKADRAKVGKALATRLPERLWDTPLLRPVQGGITSQFGLARVFNGQPRGKHRGLDLRAADGTPIQACADGVVALVDDLYYSGNTVYLNHGDGVFTAYLHMSKPLVKPGDRVTRGDVVGLAGSTGRVTGPHLHLSLYAQGQSVDPLPLLEAPAAAKKVGGPNGK